jgi:hypothetical protein
MGLFAISKRKETVSRKEMEDRVRSVSVEADAKLAEALESARKEKTAAVAKEVQKALESAAQSRTKEEI